MDLINFLLLIIFTFVSTTSLKLKRQLDVSYGSPSYKYCVCGRKNTQIRENSRIFGGNEILPHEYPWVAMMVAIIEKVPRLHCGGSLINDQYIVTAAHCLVTKYTQNQLKVILGQHDSCSLDTHTVTFSVEKFIQHPKYIVTKHLLADIMLVKLNMKVTFNAYIRPICLPERVNNAIKSRPGLVGDILGWGLSNNSSNFCTLRKTNVVIYNCQLKSFYLFCAGHPGGHDACVGDSGGPFQVLNPNNKFELIGIISSGIACGEPESPGVYSDVTYVLSWIYEMTRDSMFCWR